MGKQRFRLSHMIPNAWFYRLRDMNTTPHNHLSATYNHPRSSLCYTPKLYSSPSNRNTINVPKHVLGSIYIRPTHDSTYTNQDLFLSPSSSCYESPLFESTSPLDRPSSTSSTADVKLVAERVEDSSGRHELAQKPPQIRTKSKMDRPSKPKENDHEESIKIVEENIYDNHPRRKKMGSNSCNKGIVVDDDEKMFASSCCIVKSTFDPCKELKESMMEMIVDYNIREPKDLEKLLAFYLSLNSNEYRDVIVKAFEETWLTFNF